MARGFVMGAIWGTVVAGFGAGAMSIALGPPENRDAAMPRAVEADQMAMAAGNGSMEAASSDAPSDAVTPAAQAPAEPDATPADAAPAQVAQPGRRPVPETDVDVPEQPMAALGTQPAPAQIGADTEPPAAPRVGSAPVAPEAVPEGQGADVQVSSDAPVMPGAQAEAPGMPRPEDELSISTEPAQPPMPAMPLEQSALTAEAEATPDAEPEAAGQMQIAPETGEGPELQVEEMQIEGEDAPDVGTVKPSLGTPAGTLTSRAPAVPQGRLPTITAAEPSAAPNQTSAAVAAISGDSPLLRFAADASPAEGLPRMAIVLIDDGTGPLGPEAIETFPIPVTFAISPAHPDAAATAAAYRERGFEVMALADVPEGAQASDVEVILAGTLEAVPQAIGLLEDPSGGLQASREISSQTASYLASSGHGLVMMPKGLNTAQQLAAKEGVPSATLFRDFDGEGQDARVIRRFLDQAVFRSSQEGAVIMMGRLRADTVSALVLWGLQDRSSQVAMVPVSTVLIEGAAQ